MTATTTLSFFWTLASPTKNERLDASVQLISALERFQNDFSPNQVHDQSSSSPIDLLNAPDVAYSLRRLIRGLSSPRESSRLGFSVALTELLSRLQSIQCSDIFDLLMENATPRGSMTGQEERDVLFAQLFGCTAIIQSGLLVRTIPNQSSSTFIPSNLDAFQKLVDSLIALGDKKSWLRESAWWTLRLAIQALHKSVVSWRDEAFVWFLDRIFKDVPVWSLEKLAISVQLQELLPNEDWSSRICPPFKNKEILHSSNFAFIARLLKESQKADDENTDFETVSASWQPRLHFVWNIILDNMSSSPVTSSSFQDFFRVAVDESLFSTNASPNRKYHGFLVFQQAFPRVEPSDAPRLLTPNFMRTWTNHLSRKDRSLHKISLQLVKVIETFVKEHPESGPPLLSQLSGERGNTQFDKLTNTNTVQSILSSMNVEGVESYIHSLFSALNETKNGSSEKIIDSHRAWLFDQLSSLVKNTSIPKRDESVETILQFFIVNGLFPDTSQKKSGSTIRLNPSTPDSQAACRDQLLKCVNALMSQTPINSATTPHNHEERHHQARIPGVAASDGRFWVNKILEYISQRVSEKKSGFYGVLHKKVMKGLSVSKQLGKNKSPSPLAKGFGLVLNGLLLHHLCSEESSGDIENIKICLEQLSEANGAKEGAGTDGEDSLSSPTEFDSVDVIIDMVVGFMEREVAFLRTLGKVAFSNVTGVMSQSSVDLLLAQLEQKSPEELLAGSDDSGDDDEEEKEDDHEQPSDSSEPESQSDSDEEMVDAEEMAELKGKLEAVFGSKRKMPQQGVDDSEDEDEENSDEETSDEELMDDEQMLAIDDQLSAVFKSRLNTTKERDAQRQATHFKNRILDLVDVYLKKELSTNILALHMLLPLLDLVLRSSTDEQQLVEKARGILKSRFRTGAIGDHSGGSSIVGDIVFKVHELAQRSQRPENLKLLMEISIFLSRIPSGKNGAVIDAYKTSLVDFASRKGCGLNITFFQRFAQSCPQGAWELRNEMLSYSSNALNRYRATQILQLLLSIPVESNRLPDLDTTFRQIESKVPQLLLHSDNDKMALTTGQAKDLLKSCIATCRRFSQPSTQLGWTPESWKTLGKQLEETSRYQNSRSLSDLCGRLATSLETPKEAVVVPKRKRVEESPTELGNRNKKRRKAKTA